MDKTEYYLYLSSKDSLGVFPQNKAEDFTVKLPATLTLKGTWKCALTEVSFVTQFAEIRPRDVFICSDLVEESYGADTFRPVLRKVSIPSAGSLKVVHVFP